MLPFQIARIGDHFGAGLGRLSSLTKVKLLPGAIASAARAMQPRRRKILLVATVMDWHTPKEMLAKGNKLPIGGHEIIISHPDKVLYRLGKFTKANLIDYYMRVGPLL